MKIEKVKIEELKIAEYNPRKDLNPEDEEWKKIQRSIEEFGYVDPIIINKDKTIIGGHQRYKVLKSLGYDEIQCVVLDIDKQKEKVLNIALNKITGEWDNLKLEQLFKQLNVEIDDLSITGFDKSEINKMLKEVEEIIPENMEMDISSFNDEKFQCKCPKCGFMFDIDKE